MELHNFTVVIISSTHDVFLSNDSILSVGLQHTGSTSTGPQDPSPTSSGPQFSLDLLYESSLYLMVLLPAGFEHCLLHLLSSVAFHPSFYR